MTTLETALSAFMLQLEADGRSGNTRDQYARHLRALGRWMRGAGIDDIGALTHTDIARFLADPIARCRADGAAKRAASVNALRSTIRCAFGYWHAAGIISTNPARLVRRARCSPPPPKPLAPEHAERLMATIRASDDPLALRDAALFGLLLGAGPRISSVLAARVEDLDLGRGELLLRTTKGDRPARLFLPATACDLLRAHLGTRSTGPLFVGRAGGPLDRRSASWRLAQWCRCANIPLAGLHMLRHTLATRLISETGDVALVQRAMHHASIASTTRYLCIDEARIRAAISGTL